MSALFNERNSVMTFFIQSMNVSIKAENTHNLTRLLSAKECAALTSSAIYRNSLLSFLISCIRNVTQKLESSLRLNNTNNKFDLTK